MQRELNWAVLGTGVIANEMAAALEMMGKHLYAVGNRTYEKAAAFAEKYQVAKVYKDFHEMFTDPDVDIIYITTPHNTQLAAQNGVVFAEAMTIWHMPLYKKLWKLAELGKTGTYENLSDAEEFKKEGIPPLGKVQLIQLNFGSYKEYNMENRFFNKNLAGGALLDIGVYAISLARSFMESQPENVLSQVKYAPTGADEQVGILFMNKEGQQAMISLSLHSKQPKRAVISFERGYIEIMEYPRAARAVIVEAETGKCHEITAGETASALLYEMQDMEYAVQTGDMTQMRFSDTRDVMEIMTNLRKEWNMKYPGEEW